VGSVEPVDLNNSIAGLPIRSRISSASATGILKKLLVSKTAGIIWLAESNKVPSRSNIKPTFEIVFNPLKSMTFSLLSLRI
jgi:hypothetical protein